MTRTVLLVLISFLTVDVSFCQDYPVLRKVQIDVRVTHDSLTSMFYYDYSFTNDAKNVGQIERFKLVIWRDSASTMHTTQADFYLLGMSLQRVPSEDPFRTSAPGSFQSDFCVFQKDGQGMSLAITPTQQSQRTPNFCNLANRCMRLSL